MRITHLCLACFYPDGYAYQENLLPKFHARLGHEVSVIASLQSFDKDGQPCYLPGPSEYVNEYGLPVVRLAYKKPERIYHKLKRYVGTYEAIEKTRPDVLFIHGCQFLDLDVVVKYLRRHPEVRAYVDNHADFINSATNWLSKNILHKIVWRRTALKAAPYVRKFYGVLPKRVDFLRDVYKLPKEKVELLVMGADDDAAEEAATPEKRAEIRRKLEIADDEFMLITGGKINEFKLTTFDLMEAVNRLANDKVRLIVFGSVIPELKERFDSLLSQYSRFIGWIDSRETSAYYAAADLAVFPGGHSVFWEQVAGLGVPMMCREWEGMTHVDIGGNVRFLKRGDADEIYQALKEIVESPEVYARMKQVASEEGRREFSYRHIAEKSLS